MHNKSSPKMNNGRDYTIRTAHRQSALRLIVSLIAIIILTGCPAVSGFGTPPTVKIGLVAPFEGLHRPLGYEALFAVKLALQERNQAGGLNGYRVELVALNDFDDPAEARTQARALAADPDVLGVVGHLSAAATGAALPVYEEARLAVSVPWTTGAEDRPSGVVSIAAGLSETKALLTEVIQANGYTNVMTLATGDEIIPESGDTQAVELVTDGVTAGEIILALQESGISYPLFGQVDVGSPQLLQVAEEAANGLTYVSPGPASTDIEAAAFIEAYQALAGFLPGPRAVLTYDATNVLLDAVEQALSAGSSPPTRAKVSAAISTVKRRGLSGNIAFDAQGQRINAPVWLYQISNEEYPGVLITP